MPVSGLVNESRQRRFGVPYENYRPPEFANISQPKCAWKKAAHGAYTGNGRVASRSSSVHPSRPPPIAQPQHGERNEECVERSRQPQALKDVFADVDQIHGNP